MANVIDTSPVPGTRSAPDLYEQDFHAWTEEQAAMVRAGHLDRLDLEHIVEEIESMGARERRELVNRLAVLLAHLLKWRYQPERRCHSWRLTINEQRRQLALILEDSPSLGARLDEFLARAYGHGAQAALEQTGFYQRQLPRKQEGLIRRIVQTERAGSVDRSRSNCRRRSLGPV